MRIDPIIDYAYSVEDQSQPGHESLRRALVMAILLRDGAGNAHDAELYAIAAHPCALTQHVLIDLYLARGAISQLSASEIRPPGLTDETLLELRILGVPESVAAVDLLRAICRATHLTDNMLALALWCAQSRQDLGRIAEAMGRRLTPNEPFRAALWASCIFDHAEPARLVAAATLVVTRVTAMAQQWRGQLQTALLGTLGMWCRTLDIAIDAAAATRALEFTDLWTFRLKVAEQLERVAPDAAQAMLQFLQRARRADISYGADASLRPTTLAEGALLPWRDHAVIIAERELAGDHARLRGEASRFVEPSSLRRLALCAELGHQDRELAQALWHLARQQGLPASSGLIAELRLAYRAGNWAAMYQHYLTWAELASDATEAHAAWVGAAVAAMRRHDDSSALFCWAAAQDAAPSPIAAFGEKLLRQLHGARAATGDEEGQLEQQGDQAMAAHQPLQAAAHYRQLLAMHPGHPRYVRNLARALEHAALWTDLVELLDDQGGKVDEHAGVALLQQAARVCEERLGDAAGAAARYRGVLRRATEPAVRAATLEALARIYETTGAWRALIDTTTEQVAFAGSAADRAQLWFRCGSVSEAIFGDAGAAEAFYRKAVAASPACVPAVHSLREVLRAKRDWPAVIASLRQEVDQWSEDADRASVYAQIGAVLRDDVGDEPGAMAAFTTALEIDADCIAASLAMLDIHLQRAQWEAARGVLDRIDHAMVRHATRAEKANFACKCARLALHDEELDRAVYWAGRALATDLHCGAALEILLEVAQRAPSPWTLPSEIVESLTATPDLATHPPAWMARRDLLLAWLAAHANNLPGASALATAAQGHASNDAIVARSLARIWQRLASL
ncbi:MAG: hypothetical protein IPL79_10525 [Myxococcales bacterium]|nr:hypothetical protein [Myxococcales bacterium]